MDIVKMAGQILEMHEELAYLRHENAQLREHSDMLMKHIVESNSASEKQMHGWISGLLDGRLAVTTGADHGKG